ncbi:MAG: preprotein translocase subunit SecE [Bdellovibrionales bacterium]|nr:preprotein translocase subunit SecE [Bdellovibrionales bacterium]
MENDKKWIYLSYVIATLILSWVVNQFLLLFVNYFRVSNPMLLEVLPASAVVSLVAVSVFVFFYTRQAKVQNYSLEVFQELRKVTWPTKKTAYLSTIVVVITVIFMAVVLGFFDWMCTSFVNFIVRA